MNAKTLTALRGSIKKWEKIVAGKGVDNGPNNCPLCALFYYDTKPCAACPVSLATGYKFCVETPYDEWEQHHHDEHGTDLGSGMRKLEKGCATCRRLARAELKFLKGLLPRKEA